jgi:hypothetical protein
VRARASAWLNPLIGIGIDLPIARRLPAVFWSVP